MKFFIPNSILKKPKTKNQRIAALSAVTFFFLSWVKYLSDENNYNRTGLSITFVLLSALTLFSFLYAFTNLKQWIESGNSKKKPLEFELLESEIEQWSARDSQIVAKIMKALFVEEERDEDELQELFEELTVIQVRFLNGWIQMFDNKTR